MGSSASFSGWSRTRPSSRKNRLTGASSADSSSPASATTISPLRASCVRCTTTMSPSRIPALSIEREPVHRPGRRLPTLAADELDRAGLRRVALEQPGSLQICEVRVNSRGRCQSHCLADLPHGGRVAVLVDVVDEEVPYLLLSSRQHLRLQGRVVERVFDSRVETPADVVNRSPAALRAAMMTSIDQFDLLRGWAKPGLATKNARLPAREVRWRGLEPPRPFKATRPST